jgi:hypothetical protein
LFNVHDFAVLKVFCNRAAKVGNDFSKRTFNYKLKKQKKALFVVNMIKNKPKMAILAKNCTK